MDALHKLKVLVMFLSLATFTVMVIMNAGNATGTFKGNASKFSSFRGGFHALYHVMIQGGLDGIDLFATSPTVQIHLVLWNGEVAAASSRCYSQMPEPYPDPWNPSKCPHWTWIQWWLKGSLCIPLYPWWKMFRLLRGVCRQQWCCVWALPSWVCQELPSCFPLDFILSWLFWFGVRGKVLGVPNKGQWSHNGCLNQL